MDAISLIQSVIPLVVAIIFTGISIGSLEGLMAQRKENVLAPLWCFVAGIAWIGFGIVNVYGLTTQYFSAFTWLYYGLGALFNILAVTAIIIDVQIGADQKKAKEKDISLDNEEW